MRPHCRKPGEIEGHFFGELYYIARILNWENYKPLISNKLVFDGSFLIEPIGGPQLDYIYAFSKKISTIKLAPLECKDNAVVSVTGSYCLVIHSGSDAEVFQLLEMAKDYLDSEGMEKKIVLACPRTLPNIPPEVQQITPVSSE